jgi:hypothetical protein
VKALSGVRGAMNQGEQPHRDARDEALALKRILAAKSTTFDFSAQSDSALISSALLGLRQRSARGEIIGRRRFLDHVLLLA